MMRFPLFPPLSLIAILLLGTACLRPGIAFADGFDKEQSIQTKMDSGPVEISDPLEPLNRTVSGINDFLDIFFITPFVSIYKGIVPDPIRHAVTNVTENLDSPIIAANQALQGNWNGANHTLQRFVVNSTIGLGGVLDVAKDLNLPYESEDFGQTLGVWGVDNGFYIVLPLFGPSTLRDTTGLVVDSLADPFNHYAQNTHKYWIPVTRTTAEVVDKRIRVDGAIDDTRKNSLDPYTTFRSGYLQYRWSQIHNGDISQPDIPDYGQ